MTWRCPIGCPGGCLPYAPNPATRIGRYLLFPGGFVVKLSRRQQLLHALGLKRTAKTPWVCGPLCGGTTCVECEL